MRISNVGSGVGTYPTPRIGERDRAIAGHAPRPRPADAVVNGCSGGSIASHFSCLFRVQESWRIPSPQRWMCRRTRGNHCPARRAMSARRHPTRSRTMTAKKTKTTGAKKAAKAKPKLAVFEPTR